MTKELRERLEVELSQLNLYCMYMYVHVCARVDRAILILVTQLQCG